MVSGTLLSFAQGVGKTLRESGHGLNERRCASAVSVHVLAEIFFQAIEPFIHLFAGDVEVMHLFGRDERE